MADPSTIEWFSPSAHEKRNSSFSTVGKLSLQPIYRSCSLIIPTAINTLRMKEPNRNELGTLLAKKY